VGDEQDGHGLARVSVGTARTVAAVPPQTLAIGDDRLRVAPWRGDPTTAYVVARHGRPSPYAVARCVEQLAVGGYEAALTTALAPADQGPWLATGFTVHERLHLLSRAVEPVPEVGPASVALRRGRRKDRPDVLEVDGAAFPAFWRLDDAGLEDAITATPSARFRVACDPALGDRIVGYAVTGRAGARGYLQRLAVDPAVQRRGVGAALVADAVRWLRRWGAREVLVNTQEENERAVALYEHLGFHRHDEGLAVLQRPLVAPAR
jgi:ribosomal protein S18 acetylase RimI-like enzyme